jgi:ubiquinone/menaquinone biosynthesis C-methylase UbiE
MSDFKDFYTGKNYNQHMYNGLIGYFMTLSHKRMEKNTEKKDKVLEIGPGTHPHLKYLKHNFEEYYVVDKLKELSEFFKDNKDIKFVHQESDNLPFPDNYFDRIIISHCLEHIVDPEKVLIDIYSKLKKGGSATIALPTDPGVMWRLGKFISANFLIKKNYDFTKEHYYYFTAKDHVNSIFSLIPIIKKNFNKINFERYEPFKIPMLDFNLFYIIDIEK